MAQHDYVIANGTGAAVRSDLNNALAAIVSNNSGATEPATMYAYQWWADTSTGLLKLRNAANNAWITLRELDGTLTIEAGTVSAPGLAFASDLNTGIYSPSADQLAIATNGVERVEWGTSEVVFNDGGANYDFRIEGDTNSSLFFVDASAEAVGIGTTAPIAATHIMLSDVTGFTSPANDGLVVERGGGNDLGITIATNNDRNGYLLFADSDSSNPAWVGYDHSVNAMSFKVNASERARIDSSGRLLVGTSTARDKFNNASGETPNVQIEGTGTTASGLYMLSMTANNTSSSAAAGPAMFFGRSEGTTTGSYTVVSADKNLGRISFQGADGTEFVEAAKIDCFVDGTPGANDMPGRLVFSTTKDGQSSPTEALRINANQQLLVNNGTGLPAGTAPGYQVKAGSTSSSDWSLYVLNNANNRVEVGYRNNGVFYSEAIYQNTTANAANVNAAADGLIARSTSSIKYKTDIETIGYDFSEALLDCRPVWYRSTCAVDKAEWSWWGFIAEEVAEIDPRLVHWKTTQGVAQEDGSVAHVPCEPEPEGVAYDRFVPHLLNLIKRQKEQIEAMEARLSAIEAS